MVPMMELVRRYGFEPNRNGFICCPFHHEKTPSFKVYAGSGGFHCFGCGKHGDVISFTMDYLSLSFEDACGRLNVDFSLGLPIDKKLDLRSQKATRDAWRRRREGQKERLQEQSRIEDNYNRALDDYCACDMAMLCNPPMSDAWCEAARKINYAELHLEAAEAEVYMNAKCG